MQASISFCNAPLHDQFSEDAAKDVALQKRTLLSGSRAIVLPTSTIWREAG